MAIFDEGIYTISEASKFIEIPIRTVQRLCKKHKIKVEDGRYVISGLQLKEWKQNRAKRAPRATTRQVSAPSVAPIIKETVQGKPLAPFKTTNANTEIQESGHEIQESHEEKLRKAIEFITIEAAKQNVQHKVFTEDEYVDLIGTLDRVEYQQEQIQYLRKRVERQDEILTNLFKNMERRDYIEAKDKGHDKK